MGCVMCLLMFEKIEGESTPWKNHLSYMVSLLARGGTLSKLLEAEQNKFMCRLFVYNDVITSLALRQPLLSDDVAERHLLLPADSFLSILAQIARVSQMEFQDRAKFVPELESILDHGQWPLDWLPSFDRSPLPYQSMVGEAYICAAKVYLFRAAGWPFSTQLSNRGIELLLSIPANGRVETCLLWPFLVLGAESTHTLDRRAIHDRLMQSASRLGIWQYIKACAILQECWDSIDRGEHHSWVDVMHRTRLLIPGG